MRNLAWAPMGCNTWSPLTLEQDPPCMALTLRVGEVDDVVIDEDIDLLNARDGVHSQALQGVL